VRQAPNAAADVRALDAHLPETLGGCFQHATPPSLACPIPPGRARAETNGVDDFERAPFKCEVKARSRFRRALPCGLLWDHSQARNSEFPVDQKDQSPSR
jgi:hypothetical protein